LQISDFFFDFINHFHISDSLVWSEKNGIDNIEKFLLSEGLPIGRGNVDYEKIFENVASDKTLVMEINPENGDHNNNLFQSEAIEYFKRLYETRECARR